MMGRNQIVISAGTVAALSAAAVFLTLPSASATPQVVVPSTQIMSQGHQNAATSVRPATVAFHVDYGQIVHNNSNAVNTQRYQWHPQQCYGYYDLTPTTGYIFGGYCDSYYGSYTVPSAFALYAGFPTYILVDVGAAVAIEPVLPDNSGECDPYTVADAPVNQNNYFINNNYYASATNTTTGTQAASTPAKADYNSALADIQEAWQTGSTDLFRRHLPLSGGQIAVSINGQYSYSIDADHFAQITQDAFDTLKTYSFRVTNVQMHGDGSITGYATHIYAPISSTTGERATMYLSFSLSNSSGAWLLTAIDSSNVSLAPASGRNRTGDVGQIDKPISQN